MNSNRDGKPEPSDPEADLQMVELELMRQRAARQQGKKPYQGLRAASIFFFVAIVLGALLTFFYILRSGRLEELRALGSQASPSSITASPSP